jgi:hypothetical protein
MCTTNDDATSNGASIMMRFLKKCLKNEKEKKMMKKL